MSLIPSSRRGSKVVFDPFFLNLWDPFKDFPFPSSSSLFAIPEFSRENSAFVSTRVPTFQLPENAKVDQIKAAIENGVLSVTILKAEVKKPNVKAIEISG
ncbi:hypothetical protein D8674_006738 [Pyrus ussuriensis x Pyrus communis]|uniref:SHSP domain-containing protein n=1 Tax=Pyrus ussuriensis x Pyrus communis TaxID=2448454 RepID=A0A5N5FZL4_9ROSA|nr:hypothetical protein D8674_006725 [Pyrus ussuriensis x Pyrus communis]KAB2607021.1 hypothetical protein D8674_006738 [Pyrus ussuriensis x Pyrus communis]